MIVLNPHETRTWQDFLFQITLYQLAWFGFWMAFKRVTRNSKKWDNDIKNRLMSMIDNFVVLYCALHNYFKANSPLNEAFNTPCENSYIAFHASFLVFDSVILYAYGIGMVEQYLHNLTVGLGCISVLHEQRGGALASLGLLLIEFPKFMGHMRHILRHRRLKMTAIFELTDLIYLIEYIVFRGVLFVVYFLLLTKYLESVPVLYVICFIIVIILSFSHIYQCISLLQDFYNRYQQRADADVDLWWFSISPQARGLSYHKGDHKSFPGLRPTGHTEETGEQQVDGQ